MKVANYKYIKIILEEEKLKTNVYSVINKQHNVKIGTIKWSDSWRKYNFYPESNTMFDETCMYDISVFIHKLMADRKRKKKKR